MTHQPTSEEEGKVDYPKYRPRSYQQLQAMLGRADAGLEWLEVGIRHLKMEHDTGGSSRTDKLAETYGVKVNAFEWRNISTQWAHLQIVSVCQYLEWFLDEFRREFPRQLRARKDKEVLLHYVLDIFDVSENNAGTLEVAILDYYRLVRNRFLHEIDVEEPKKLTARRERIRAAIHESPYSLLNAPNEADSLQFDDFILFTRALKIFSRGLCTHAQPTMGEIVNLIGSDAKFTNKLRKWRESRRIGAILAGYIRQRFGFPSTADSISATIIKDDLLAHSVELPLQEPIEVRSVAEGGGRGSSPRQVTKKKKRSSQ